MGTIIRTDGMIENPEYLYNGYVLNFDKTKWTNNFLLYIDFNPLFVSQGRHYTMKSYGDQLRYSNNTLVEGGELSYIGNMPVYTYTRPYGLNGDRSNQFHIAENTVRADIIYDDPKNISFGVSPDNTGEQYYLDYVKTSFEQLVFHNSKLYWKLFGSYCNVYIDFAQVDIDESLTNVFVSGNKLAKGNVANLAKAGNALTTIAFYRSNVSGSLEDFANSAARIINNAKTIMVSGYLSKITYQGRGLANGDYQIAFDGNGGYTITEP